MASILFVCTGNVFRSMSAEFLARRHSSGSATHTFFSAGTGVLPWEDNPVQPAVRVRLQELGADPGDNYRPTQVSSELLKRFDLVVAMSDSHKATLSENYSAASVLFMQIATGEQIGVKDVNEFYPDWKVNPAAHEYTRNLVNRLDMLMPDFLSNLHRYV